MMPSTSVICFAFLIHMSFFFQGIFPRLAKILPNFLGISPGTAQGSYATHCYTAFTLCIQNSDGKTGSVILKKSRSTKPSHFVVFQGILNRNLDFAK
ncbi:unnamed protein product [Ixodes pacificus]